MNKTSSHDILYFSFFIQPMQRATSAKVKDQKIVHSAWLSMTKRELEEVSGLGKGTDPLRNEKTAAVLGSRCINHFLHITNLVFFFPPMMEEIFIDCFCFILFWFSCTSLARGKEEGKNGTEEMEGQTEIMAVSDSPFRKIPPLTN